MFKNSILKENGLGYGQKFVCSDNPGQNICHKVKNTAKLNKTTKSWYLILRDF